MPDVTPAAPDPSFLESPVFSLVKRLVVFLVGLLVVALNKKWGLNLDSTEVASVAIMVLGYVFQSAWKQVASDKAKAAAANVTTTDAAVAVLKGP
jgi:hypothetical protein